MKFAPTKHQLMPLIEKLGEKAWEFHVKQTPDDDEPFYLYKHNRIHIHLAVTEKGEAWVYSPEADKYVPSDWQTEINRFAAKLDLRLHPCHKMAWEAEITAARKANAEPYSDEHHDAEVEHFCREFEKSTGEKIIIITAEEAEVLDWLEARLGSRVESQIPMSAWNPTQKGPVN